MLNISQRSVLRKKHSSQNQPHNALMKTEPILLYSLPDNETLLLQGLCLLQAFRLPTRIHRFLRFRPEDDKDEYLFVRYKLVLHILRFLILLWA